MERSKEWAAEALASEIGDLPLDFGFDHERFELLGARGATVDDVTGAGAVYIFPGVDDPDLRSFGMGGQAVVHSSPTRGAEIGFDVAAAPGLSTGAIRRDEVIAGAPGVNRIYVMLCTGVDGDSVSDFDGTRCQPTN